MYHELFQRVGLSKSEAQIYETLLREGELSAGRIAIKAKVHRRNVYDAIKSLIGWGIIFEIPGRSESSYKPRSPECLRDILQQRKQMLGNFMPALHELYHAHKHKHEVYIYRGAEGWKNYMRDMLRVGEDAYFIAAKGGWLDPRVKNFFPHFIAEAKKKKMNFFHLFDHEVQEQVQQILPYVGKQYKFLPPGYSAPGALDFFGDYVNLLSRVKYGTHPEDISFVVIVNRAIADAFRTWFKFMWEICP